MSLFGLIICIVPEIKNCLHKKEQNYTVNFQNILLFQIDKQTIWEHLSRKKKQP